jgi:hypothetical protein
MRGQEKAKNASNEQELDIENQPNQHGFGSSSHQASFLHYLGHSFTDRLETPMD